MKAVCLDLAIQYEGKSVRVVGTPDSPEWVAVDVCSVLGLSNPSAALAEFPEGEKGITLTDTLGGSQQLLTVTEPGLYRLISRSRKPEAQIFQRFIFHDVLPSIRQHGCWPPPQAMSCAGKDRAIVHIDPDRLPAILELSLENAINRSQRICRIENRIEFVENQHKDTHAKVSEILERTRGARKDLLEQTKLAHCFFVRDHKNRKCPICRRTEVVDEHANKIGEAEFDHFSNRELNRFTDTWLLCFACHLAKTKRRKANAEEQTLFKTYQYEAALFGFGDTKEQPPKKHSDHPTLF